MSAIPTVLLCIVGFFALIGFVGGCYLVWTIYQCLKIFGFIEK